MIPRLIVVPLSSHEVDGVRKEKERLTAAVSEILWIIDTAVNREREVYESVLAHGPKDRTSITCPRNEFLSFFPSIRLLIDWEGKGR